MMTKKARKELREELERDAETMNDTELLNKFGGIIDEYIKDTESAMLLKIPKGTVRPTIECTLSGGPVINLYILTHAYAEAIRSLVTIAPVNEDKLPDMLDGIFDMIKGEVLAELAEDEEESEEEPDEE